MNSLNLFCYNQFALFDPSLGTLDQFKFTVSTDTDSSVLIGGNNQNFEFGSIFYAIDLGLIGTQFGNFTHTTGFTKAWHTQDNILWANDYNMATANYIGSGTKLLGISSSQLHLTGINIGLFGRPELHELARNGGWAV